MERNEVLEVFRNAAVELLEVEADAVVEQASFQDDLDVDSLDLVEFVMELEDRFGTRIPESDLEGVRTVGDAIDRIMPTLGELV